MKTGSNRRLWNAIDSLRQRRSAWKEEASNNFRDSHTYVRCIERATEIETCIALVQLAFFEPNAGNVAIRILRDGVVVAEFADASLARMALVMFQSNEAANGNTAHAWTLEGE